MCPGTGELVGQHILVPQHTTQILYEVHGQTIWWKIFKKYCIEQAHFSINHTIFIDIRVIEQTRLPSQDRSKEQNFVEMQDS